MPVSQQHAHAFRQSVDAFFQGLETFLTASEHTVASAGGGVSTSASPDDVLQKLYQRYMQMEVETDNLAIYLAQTETKLRAEMAEPQVTVEQLQAQQARYLAHQKEVGRKAYPPLPPTIALFRAQYELYAHPDAAAPGEVAAIRGAAAAGARAATSSVAPAAIGGVHTPQRTPTSGPSSSGTPAAVHSGHTPRTPASLQQLLTPNHQLTPNQQPSPQHQLTTADQSADVEIL